MTAGYIRKLRLISKFLTARMKEYKVRLPMQCGFWLVIGCVNTVISRNKRQKK